MVRLVGHDYGNWHFSDWDVSPRAHGDIGPLLRRLAPRVTYGGRKGWRAFRRLWDAGIRPHREFFRVSVIIKGFELDDEAAERLMTMAQGPTVVGPCPSDGGALQ